MPTRLDGVTSQKTTVRTSDPTCGISTIDSVRYHGNREQFPYSELPGVAVTIWLVFESCLVWNFGLDAGYLD